MGITRLRKNESRKGEQSRKAGARKINRKSDDEIHEGMAGGRHPVYGLFLLLLVRLGLGGGLGKGGLEHGCDAGEGLK